MLYNSLYVYNDVLVNKKNALIFKAFLNLLQIRIPVCQFTCFLITKLLNDLQTIADHHLLE
jgi:hypothetical protein